MRRACASPARAVLAAVTVIVFASACSTDRPNDGGAAAASSLPNPATILQPSAGATVGSPGSSPGRGPAGTPGAGETPGASPSPIDIGYPDKVPVSSTITPACVVRGGAATIEIRTEPRIAVGYHAVYAGTKGGAPPPFGHGYGGNDKGFSDERGRYTSTWVVRADAPVGPARADVVVADGEDFGYDDPPFYVAASQAGCPA